ncbi:MAG: polysaccharide deacetylase family protein [Bacteroidetes bacterium]|nr:MAG: polysaccharide deacetylase family protein [Bacteroidota bacterium]
MFYRIKTPAIIKKAYPRLIWDMPSSKAVYLTFDDGPTPGVTDKVLQILKQFDAKATFFCIGKNVLKYPELFRQIIQEGHAIGNHTYNHLNGFSVNKQLYRADVQQARELIETKLFRPPYGKIKRSQIKDLCGDYRIIMWSVLSGDFDKTLSPERIYCNVVKYVKEGSIVTFHDSLKAKNNLLPALPRILDYLKENNLECKKIII